MAKVQHTCTGCVPIDASIIDVYVTLVETNKSVTAAEASRSEAESARVAAEAQRTAAFATDHDRAVADHSIAQSDHATAGSDHEATVAATNAANAAAAVANAKAELVQARLDTADADHTRAEGDHGTAVSDHSTASTDHTMAQSDHETAGNDHTRAESDHSIAASDHTASASATAAATGAAELANTKAGLVQEKLDRADTDHDRAESDHTIATSDHTAATADHAQASADHTQAGTDHGTAAADHTTATSDHTQAGQDHTLAAADHVTAGEDHEQAQDDHEVMEGYDTRLTNTETEVSQLRQEVTADVSQLEADFAEFKGGSMDVTDTLVFEQGGIATADGSNQSSQQQIRSNFIPAKSVAVSVTNGSVYVYGWADNTYKGARGWKTGSDNTVEIAGANKYKVVFKKSSGSLSPSGFPDLGATVVANYSAEVVKVTPQSLTDAEKQQARMNIDALPASAEASIKAYSDAAILLNANKVAGKGETVVSVALVLMPNTRYKFNIPNPSWAYSGSQVKLQLKVTGGNQLFAYQGQKEVPRFIYFVTGNYTDFTLYIRANTGTDFTYIIENVDEVDRQFIMGVKPYFTPSRIEGGWRIVINSSTSLHPNWDQSPYTPSGATFDFTDTDKLLVFNQIANEYALRDSTILHGDTVLLDYRGASQNFVGGLFFPYFVQFGAQNFPEYATASGFDIDENGKVSWDSLSIHKKDNTVATFSADSFAISLSAPALVLRSATGQIVTTALANINASDRILLALYDGMYFGMLAYLVEKKKLTSWYADEYELNIKRFGDQLKNVKWTPKADVRSNEGLNEAGVEVTGVPYSSVKEELKFVGVDVSLHTFMTAINDIHSLMYTENVSANGSQSAYGKTYHGVNSICYFGSVCSGFVTTAIGGIVQFNSWEYQTYPERFHIIEEQDEQNLKVGDIISEPGHCAIVTRLYRTLAGKITDIEVSEHGAPLRTTTYRLQSLIDRRKQTGIVYCRMNNRSWIDKYVTYTPSPFVLADGEMLYTGGDFVYRDGATRAFYRCTQQNRDSSFVNAKWQSVPVFATGTEIPVNNYRQYGERLYRCKVTHTPTEFDPDKWEYLKGVKEWASYPYTYNDDIVTFAGDRAAFRLGEDIYINFVKGSYTKMQVYKEETLLDELTLGDDYQLDITSLIVSPGLYKARLSDGTNFSRYTYFEVIDATVTATIENGVATVNYSSNYGTPIDAQIVELSGFPICHFAVDGGNTIKIDPQAGLYRQRHHYYGRYNNYSQTVYARVVFAGEYGNIASEMVSIGTLEPITGKLVYPGETIDLETLSGANNIILTDGLIGKRYDFTFVASSDSSISLRSVLGSLKWAETAPVLQDGNTYIFSIINGIVRYEEIYN